jgi:hypothetical protein
MIEIIHLATRLCETTLQDYEWYRSVKMPSLGNLTAEALIKQGKSKTVLIYIRRIISGSYA